MSYFKYLVFFLFIIFSPNIKAQNINAFYFEVNTAHNFAVAEKLDSAIATYENAFKKVDYVHIIHLKKMVKLARLNQDEERMERYSQQIIKQSKGTNTQLKDIIDSLIVLDQKMRKRSWKHRNEFKFYAKCNKDENCDKQSKKYLKSKLVVDDWCKVDSSNTHFLLNLFKQFGFIGEELIGLDGYNNLRVILLHFDQDTSNIILEPVLKKALNEGKIRPIDFSTIMDRHLGGKFTIQKYWTLPHVSKTKFPFSEADIPKIIKLRESIGIYGSKLRQEYKKGNWILRIQVK